MTNLYQEIAGLSAEERELFELLLKQESTGASRSLILPRRQETQSLPLSFAQERLWFLDRLEPGSSAYNLPTSVRLRGTLKVEALERSLNAIMARHESLRTTFQIQEGQTVQVIAPPGEQTWPLPIFELISLPEAERENAARRQVIEEVQRPFDLVTGPLVRARLLRLADEDHVLVLTLHHIISDGWSLGVLVREVATFYGAFASGRLSADEAKVLLPQLSIQYPDFALWQRGWLSGEILENQINYWKKQLAGAPTLQLPTDRPRPLVQTFNGSSETIVLPASLIESLKALSQHEGATLFMTLLAAFQVLLQRYGGHASRDIVVGSPTANRTRAEIEDLIGFFVNMLVLRTDLSGDPTFRELLARVREVAVGAFDHQDLPFERLVEVLQPERDLSRQPLFQVSFVLQNAPLGALELAGLDLSFFEMGSGSSKFDLTLFLTEINQELIASFEYNTDLFDASTIQRMLAHWQRLLEGVVANPDQRLSELPLLTETERRQLLTEWNATERAYSRERCLHELFEAQVERTPEATAVIAHAPDGLLEKFTYAELNQRANQLAHYLRKKGAGPNVPVGVCLERSVDLVIGLLAVLKAGGCYVPLDPAYPAGRLAFMLADARIEVLVTKSKGLVARDWGLAGEEDEGRRTKDEGKITSRESRVVIFLDTDWSLISQSSISNPQSAISPDDLLYLIFTSGSTGRPKGAGVYHRGFVNLLEWYIQEFGINAADHTLLVSSPSFDLTQKNFFAPLVTGGELHLLVTDYYDPAQISAAIEAGQITLINCAPSAFYPLVEEGGSEAWKPLSTLRGVCLGGEPIHLSRIEEWLNSPDCHAEISNTYGPTECTDISAFYRVRQPEQFMDRSVLTGKPIPNAQVYILDEHLEPVPVGVAGELCVAGVGVGLGYVNDAGLTAEKFVPNPFVLEEGRRTDDGRRTKEIHRLPSTVLRLYRTGDLARYLPDGNIEFLGRLDHQVKVRGFRIELGEIEAALKQHPAVRESVVIALEAARVMDEADESNRPDKRLVAYVVQHADHQDAATQALEAQEQAEQLAQWQIVHNEIHRQSPTPDDPLSNLAGWNSSYTGQPIPVTEMRAWVENTVTQIIALKPKRVLEIGCGSGLLLLRIAPTCERYWGTDFAEAALAGLQQQVERLALPQVSLFQKFADDFTGIEPDSCDVVILNSVIQYFPSADYLLRVLEGAVRALVLGGYLFLGDLRNYALLEAFHTSVQLYQAPDDLPVTHLRQRLSQQLRREEELLLAPSFFTALQAQCPAMRICQVQVRVKRGAEHNELTKFRYDVILQVGGETAPDTPSLEIEWRDWQRSGLSLAALRQRLMETQPIALGLSRVPNARLQSEGQALELMRSDAPPATVGELRAALADLPSEAIDPEAFWALSNELPCAVDVYWTDENRQGDYDVILRRKTDDGGRMSEEENLRLSSREAVLRPSSVHRPPSSYASNPLQGLFARRLAPELRTFLQDRLPDYMMPSAFVLLESLPLTPNGKVDRKALPTPDSLQPLRSESYVAPRDEVEESLAKLWKQLLGIGQVGAEDNFFQLDGHSLLATQLVSRVREAFGVELPLRAIFESPTIAGIAERIRHAHSGPVAPPIRPVPRDQNLPLSFAQQRLWFVDQMQPGSSAFNIPAAVRLTGALNVAALEQGLNEIIRRHEVLRTSFQTVNNEPRQVIASELALPLTVRDLRPLAEIERESEARRLAGEEAQRPFDLARGPLIRAGLLRLDEEEYVLLLTLHHIVSDGWSMEVILREVAVLYQAYGAGQDSPLPELPIQYADFAVWQRDWLRGEVLEEQLAYWKKTLGGNLPVIELPTDRPRPATPTFRGATQSFRFSPALSESLKRLGREEGYTLFMVLLAGFQTLLYRHSGQEDIVLGADVANRNRAEIEPLVGFFVNQLVLRTNLGGKPRFRELLARVREVVLGAQAHQDLPFEKLVEVLRPKRLLNQTPLFQVKVAFQSAAVSTQETPGLKLSPLEVGAGLTKYDLTLFLWDTGPNVIGNLEYSTDLFDAATITRLVHQYETLLNSLVAQPEARLDDLELLTESERSQVRMEQQTREKSAFKQFKSVKPKAVSLPQGDLIKTDTLRPGERLPLVIQPALEGLDLADWSRGHREFIESRLLEHGAILFRGFNVTTPPAFEQFAQTLCAELYDENGEHPHVSVSGKVYTPVFYPPTLKLLWHNENSFNRRWPMRIWFCCAQPAAQGGETPVADSRKVFELLDPALRERFLEKQIMYVRNYGDGLGLNWQDVFGTTSKAEVEAACQTSGMTCEWKDGDRLRTRCVRPAAGKHPKTGEMVWFNQAQHWHVSCLDPDTGQALKNLFQEADLPRSCYYGDGSPIEDATMQAILDVYQKLEVSFPWEAGDILMLDNMLTAHARNPFSGERKILVTMGEMTGYEEL